MSNLERIEGYRWAKDTAAQIGLLSNTIKGINEIVEVLKRGTVEKPTDYATGVQQFINQVEALRK